MSDETYGRQPLISLPMLSIILESSDIERHTAFYLNGLDFRVERGLNLEKHGMVALTRGAILFGFVPSEGKRRLPGRICLHVRRVEPWYTRAKARGLPLAEDIADRCWGVRSFVLVDPEGYRLEVAQKVRGGDKAQEPHPE